MSSHLLTDTKVVSKDLLLIPWRAQSPLKQIHNSSKYSPSLKCLQTKPNLFSGSGRNYLVADCRAQLQVPYDKWAKGGALSTWRYSLQSSVALPNQRCPVLFGLPYPSCPWAATPEGQRPPVSYLTAPCGVLGTLRTVESHQIPVCGQLYWYLHCSGSSIISQFRISFTSLYDSSL